MYLHRCIYFLCFLAYILVHDVAKSQKRDSIPSSGVSPTQITDAVDINRKYPYDLKTPQNIKTDFIYDEKTNTYLYITKLGDKTIGTPLVFTPKEYFDFISRQRETDYFVHKSKEDKIVGQSDVRKKPFNPFDIQFDIGAAEKIFGPGGIRLRMQGSAEVSMGYRLNKTENPSLSENARKNGYFDFNEKIQAGVQASVGDKLNFNMNYNTASTFDVDAKKLKLSFEGKEDDIIKVLEAGNVSMIPRNSLINGGQALFGLHSKMQFGKLTLDMLFSQQKSESKRIQTKGGAQLSTFEISADKYDANKHFFLGFYFRNNYDEAMKKLPFISSVVRITKMEVWVTNLNGRYDNARNIVAFTDLGEVTNINNNAFQANSNDPLPNNNSNTLYNFINSIPGIRTSDDVKNLLGSNMKSGNDYEKIESARKLNESEYSYNPTLGYISLNAPLNNNQVLAVAYEYIANGKVYKVGEFSSDNQENTKSALMVKLLKGTTLIPSSPYWKLMMRNVYSLGNGVYNVQADRFKLDVLYRNDASGIYAPYLPEGEKKGTPIISILGLDNINTINERNSDGLFDFVEGYTIDTKKGIVYFPTVEPFGKTIESIHINSQYATKYSYRSLYDKSQTEAGQDAEKNKFLIKGTYKSSNSGQISLGSINVTPGSVVVVAAGQRLTENQDYVVDYMSGIVTITNKQILDSGTAIDVSLENTSFASIQRKTMMGIDLNYQFSRNLNLGATVMHLSEMPLINKTVYGQEALQNTIWGTNIQYNTKSMWLTNILNYIPFVDLSRPSEFTFSGEFANLIPGHYKTKYNQGYSYIDDFETSQNSIDLMNPYMWHLASIPQDDDNGLFPESKLSNDIRVGNHRAMTSWFTIDPILNMENYSLTPAYIRNNPDYVSNHFVRQINTNELFPLKDLNISERTYISTFNICYYPEDRGPYNLSDHITNKGKLLEPQYNWGGLMRALDQTDFEASGIEYIEFWLMDPFVYDKTSKGGQLYINLGDISEDVIKDDKLFYENGMPIINDQNALKSNVWGNIPAFQPFGYAFDNAEGARAKQDVGLNGLSTKEELTHPTYTDYINRIKSKLDNETYNKWKNDPFSPINDPAGDNFHHYRGDDFDNAKLPILERYKYYNGTENNSAETKEDNTYSIASTLSPDVEDLNGNNNLETEERYYQYKIELNPNNMYVGQNYIVNKRTSTVTMRNGQRETVDWYQFKIPVRNYSKAVNGISDYKSIRFMRIFLHGFSERINLRFATLKLIRGDWRIYNKALNNPQSSTVSNGSISINTVGFEENGDRTPINYILPPGVSRQLDGNQTQTLQQNEQSISLKVQSLSPDDARAIYKNVNFDMRRYRTLQMFVHAEKLTEDITDTRDGDFSVFIRIGSDYLNNYYEYSVPLKLTPNGRYNNDIVENRNAVWPLENKMEIELKKFVEIKNERNKLINSAHMGVDYYNRYTKILDNNILMSIIGNPTLSDITTIMIGIRNNSKDIKSIEVWCNELRLSDYEEEGGWAANANMNLQLSDLANINIRGQYITAGFGSIDQSLNERRLDDFRNIALTTSADLGRFFPKKAKIRIPIYYSLTSETTTPKYNPTDQDILLKDAIASAIDKSRQDSVRSLAIVKHLQYGITINNAKVDISSEKSMPYDPANISFSYSKNITKDTSPNVEYSNKDYWQLSVNYDYTTPFRPLKPFSFIKKENSFLSFVKNYDLSLWPSRLSLQSNITRNYEEEQVRNYTDGGSDFKIPATFAQNFLWNRRIVFSWDLTKRLSLSFDNNTDARIEEPYMQVNKRLDPDGYNRWRDSVYTSIKNMGTPLRYSQTTTLNYRLPTEAISFLNWISAQSTYTSTYTWDMGARYKDPDIVVGNSIANQMNLNTNGQINIRSLLMKSNYLSNLIRRVENPNVVSNSKNKKKESKESDGIFSSLLDNMIYAMCMIKDVNISYRLDNSTIVPGFIPSIGAFIGQSDVGGMSAPGFKFAFGLNNIDEVDKMADKGWLVNTSGNINPATFTSSKSFDMRASIMPLRDLNITINFNHTDIRRTDENYMFAGRPRTYGGSFVMSTIGIKGFFDFAKGENGYRTDVFDSFMQSRGRIKTRQISDINNPEVLVSENSPVVLIPSFIQNYTLLKNEYSPMPDILSTLPNWSISYSGLNKISWIKKHFKSINIRHAYSGTYRIDNYNSFSMWHGDMKTGILGFVPSDGNTKNKTVSYAFDIASISMQESFAPLIGIDINMTNGLDTNIGWRKNRGVVLSLSSFQMIESNSDEINLGMNYRITDLRELFTGKSTRKSKSSKKGKDTGSPKGLILRFNYSFARSIALIRKIQDNYTQATQGNISNRLSISADYDISRLVTLKAFYEWDQNKPLISTSSFPMSNSNFGISFKVSLTQ